MKKKTTLGIVLTLSLLTVAIVATGATTLAVYQTNQTKFYGTEGIVTLQIPSNASYPAKAGGTPNHPIAIRFAAWDFKRRSTFGAFDQLTVSIWDPVGEYFTPVLFITDSPAQAEFVKEVLNNTYVWYPRPPTLPPIFGPNLFPNVIVVQPNELEVWTESTKASHGNGGWNWDEYGRYVWNIESSSTLMVNLTKAVKSTLDLFIINATAPMGPNRFANVTFNLPPLSMYFRELDKGFPTESTTVYDSWPGASGYTLKEKNMEVSARVNVEIPDWIGELSWDFIGRVNQEHFTTFTPPA